MDARVLKEIIIVIKAEERRRAAALADEDPNVADYLWVSTDAPFVNELCLMLLVTLRHQIERDLIRLAARAADAEREIDGKEYEQEVRALSRGDGWSKVEERLRPETCAAHDSVEVLRRLANSYKHDPNVEPQEALLKLLELETGDGINYAALPESGALQEGLAKFLGLGTGASYYDIAERFIELADVFLADVRSRTKVSPVKWGRVSNRLDNFAR